MDNPEEFLLDHPEPRSWQLPEGGRGGVFTPLHLFLGEGDTPLEVVVATASTRPNLSDVRQLWKRRRGNRASPVLLVVLYQQGGQWSVAVCGPIGEDPAVLLDRDQGQVERMAQAALAEPNRHAATRFLVEVIGADQDELPGIRNVGMFSTHALTSELSTRHDWELMTAWGKKVLGLRGRQLVEGLGFDVDQFGASASLLRIHQNNVKAAVAVFLDDHETPDGAYERFGGTTAASYALAVADQEQLPFVVITRGSQIRLYTATKHTGVGRKGRAETFVEANLNLLPDDLAGALPLIFGAAALQPGGSFEELLDLSKRYATGLGERLRDRVYKDVVPQLAEVVAKHHHSTSDTITQSDLDDLYETAMVILFRMLFVAYAEDKDLLPYRSNGLYQRNALKTLAQDLADRLNEDRLEFDPNATSTWGQLRTLWRAVAQGNRDWDIPPYDGGMFSADPEVSNVGARIEALEVTNAEIGSALAALLVDRSPEGVYGPVDFRSLSVREFGTIYEGLLESSLSVAESDLTTDEKDNYVPAGEGDEVVVPAGRIYLHDRSGTRKATGSYFTKPFAVEHLLDHALDPVIDEHLARIESLLDEGDEVTAAESFFDLRVADIAMGSGHFLVAAVDHIEARLSTFLARRPIPRVLADLQDLRRIALDNLGEVAGAYGIEDLSLLRRFIARRCIYGVDLNLVAVGLARLSIWIHTFVPGLPLSFLDHNLVQGNSLTGIATLDEAIDILAPDAGKAGTPSMLRGLLDDWLRRAETDLRRLGRITDATTADVKEARQAHAAASAAVGPVRQLFDLLVAIRVDKADRIEDVSDETVFGHPQLGDAQRLARKLEALHFPVAFPEVFLRDRSGFDCMLGNPPWDKVRFEAQQFWVTRDPGLNSLPAQERDRRIELLRTERPDEARREQAEKEQRELLQELFLAAYPNRGSGHLDYAKLFLERALQLLHTSSGLGYVLPRQALVLGGWSKLRRLTFLDHDTRVFQARNKAGWLFDDVHHSYMIILLARLPRSLGKGQTRIWGAAKRLEDLDAMTDSTALFLSAADLEHLSDTLVVPWFNDIGEVSIFEKIAKGPRLAGDEGWISAVSESRWDFSGSGRHREYASTTPDGDAWRVLMARHVDRLTLNLDKPFQRFIHNPAQLTDLGLGVESAEGTTYLASTHPLTVYRYPSRSDDARTLIATALPASGFLPSTGYVHAIRAESAASMDDTLALLGYMASYTCDWWVRRFVDRHVTAPVMNNLRLPDWGEQTRKEVAIVTARLVRFAGVKSLPGWFELPDPAFDNSLEQDELFTQLELHTLRGFRLDAADLERILDDFSDTGCPVHVRELMIAAAESELGRVR